jgi:hypothetical protein
VYETVVDWEYEQKCTTSYEEECHGYGYHQECEKVEPSLSLSLAVQVPKEHCKQVPKKVEKQVPRTKCRKVPDKRCQDFPINVPRKECKEFPKTVCTQVASLLPLLLIVPSPSPHRPQDPVNVAKKIPKKTCIQIPREVCNKIPRQIIKEVPKKVGKKVCTSTKPATSYGHAEPSYSAPAPSSYSAPSDGYSAPPPSDYGAPPASGYSTPQDSYGSPPGYGHRRAGSSKRSPAGLSSDLSPRMGQHSAKHSGGRAPTAGPGLSSARRRQAAAQADNWARGPG